MFIIEFNVWGRLVTILFLSDLSVIAGVLVGHAKGMEETA